MSCKDGWKGVLVESKIRQDREKNTPQKFQENITGFIVEVITKNQAPIDYVYDNKWKILQANESFIGYFWQMTERQDDGTFQKAHIRETRLRDIDKKIFSYGGEAVFSYDEVLITIRALRGPDSNNRFLSKEFKKYETWNDG
ncbi:hypothetical protein [Crenothrix sp.]|uniref:hypothetical protein n=1 Tax=Crenothrix sp. TaxID=3100433 RepID=UPI00374D3A05